MGIVTAIRDGLANIMTGAGTTADKRTHAFYTLRHLDPAQAEAAYRTSWLVRKIIDLPPEDMTREWRDWQADKQQIEALEAEEKRLQLPTKVCRALVLSRLYGGGALYLGNGDADPSQELRADRIAKGGLRFVHLFSRWELSHGEKRLDPEDPWFGMPDHFEITAGRGARVRIHPSRMVCFVGQPAPEGSRLGNMSWFWGDSIMQSIEDAVTNADMAQNGFAALIDEAAVDVFSIPDLMANVASSEYEARMLQRLALAKLGQSTHRAKLMDANETWQTRQINWSGMPEIIHTYLNIVAGAADIPVTRLLGQSPKGLQSTGNGEERDYKDMIAAKQGQVLRPALDCIDELLIRSALGSRPAEVYYTFASLFRPTDKELLEIEKLAAEVAQIMAASGLIVPDALAKAVVNRMVESGQWPGLDEAVDEVKRDLELNPPDDGTDPSALQAGPEPRQLPQRRAANDRKGGAPTGGRPFVDAKRSKARGGRSSRTVGQGFDPAKHPRGPTGRFVSTGGGSTRAQVKRLARQAMLDRTFQLRVSIGPVRNAADIETAVGKSVAGYRRTIDADHIRKALRDHGNPAVEAARKGGAQVPVTRRDFERAKQIVENGRIIKAVKARGRGGSASVTYEATIGRTRYFYVERINHGVREAAFKTMWKKPL